MFPYTLKNGFHIHNNYIYYHFTFKRPYMENITLDPLLRGLCELKIEEKLTDIKIDTITKLIDRLELGANTKEDAAFMIFLGTIYDELNNQCLKVYERLPNDEEISSFHHLLKKRFEEIKKKFSEHSAQKHLRELDQNAVENIVLPLEMIGDIEKDTQYLPDNFGVTHDIEIDFYKKRRRRSILGIPIIA